MLQKSTIGFLKKLERNNNKKWFDANRASYLEAREDFIAFVEDILHTIAKFDPRVLDNDPRSCLFRLNRDIRFSKEKTPYKTWFGSKIKRGGGNSPYAGYFARVGYGINAGIAVGIFAPEPDQLKNIRIRISERFPEFRKIISAAPLCRQFSDLQGDTLKKVPKGFEAGDPAGEYLKYKYYCVRKPFGNDDFLGKDILDKCAEAYKSALPLVEFLNNSIK